MTTLQTALSPLLTFGAFWNLSVFEYPLGLPRPYLSYLYTLSTWSLLTYFFYYRTVIYTWKNFRRTNITDWTYIVKLIITITLIFVSLFRVKELKMCLHELSIVDNTLEALGASKKYQRLRNWIIRMIIGWIVYGFSCLLLDHLYIVYYYKQNSNYIGIFLPIVMNYPRFVITLSALILGTIVGYTSSRFHQVNNSLYVLCSDFFENDADYERRNRSISVRQHITGIKNRKHYIWIIMHVHLQLCFISRKLNKIFNIQLLLSMLWYFMDVIEFCSPLCYWFKYVNDASTIWIFKNIFIMLYNTYFLIFQSVIFLASNYVCQTVYYKTNETVAILYKLSNYSLDEDLREQDICSHYIMYFILIAPDKYLEKYGRYEKMFQTKVIWF